MMNGILPPAPPPAPHAPPAVHHNPPPGQFQDRPRAFPHHDRRDGIPTPGMGIVNEEFLLGMRDLNLHNRSLENERGLGMLQPLDRKASLPFYQGWRFYRADPKTPGELPNWRRPTKTPMNLTQSELEKLVREGRRRTQSTKQYLKLGKERRAHIDQVIEEAEDEDPRFRWTFAYVNSNEREVNRKMYETLSMDVIIQRSLKSKGAGASLYTNVKRRSPTRIVDLDGPIEVHESNRHRHFEPDIKGIPDNPGVNGPFRPGPAFVPPQHMANPGPAHGFHRPVPEQMMGAQQPIMVNSGFPPGPPHHPGMMNGPRNGNEVIEIIGDDLPFPPRHNAHQGGGPEQIRGHLDRGPGAPFIGVQPGQPGHPHPQVPPRVVQAEGRSRSPRHRHGPDLTPDTSSVEDDQSLFEGEDDSSETEDLYEDALGSVPARGSLHVARKPYRRPREHSAYRPHYRKPPLRTIEGGRPNRYSTAVDLYPENSVRTARREITRRTGYEGDRIRPMVIYDDHHGLRGPLGPPADLADLHQKLRQHEREREQREFENLRTRRLDHREDDVTRREKEVAFRERNLIEAHQGHRRYSTVYDPPRREPRYLTRSPPLY